MQPDPFTMAEQLHKLCPSLAAEVAKCCEQAYRRGYQQGALYGHGLDDQVADWRFNLDPSIPYQTDLSAHYATASAPPDARGERRAWPDTSLERLDLEASNASPLIHWLAHQATQNR